MLDAKAYRVIDGDPDPATVHRLTFVPFLPDGRCMERAHPFAADGGPLF